MSPGSLVTVPGGTEITIEPSASAVWWYLQPRTGMVLAACEGHVCLLFCGHTGWNDHVGWISDVTDGLPEVLA